SFSTENCTGTSMLEPKLHYSCFIPILYWIFSKKAIRRPDKLFSTPPEIGAIEFSETCSYEGVTIL
ncbi:MAG TPA: hypothetical protein PLH83_16405, partial [Ruminococcus sp.]|nr:hypothetical protein [Ruminococcus sp.]